MGQVAAEIAHEVGTPLNVIGGRARTLARRPDDPAEVHYRNPVRQMPHYREIVRDQAFNGRVRPAIGNVQNERKVPDRTAP